MKWERIAPRCREHAHKLRQALAGALELHGSKKWGREEIESAGLRDYAQVFGHRIASRTFWRLFDRTLARGAGTNDLGSLELYLPTVISAKPKMPAFEKAAADLPNLTSAVFGVGDPSALTSSETLLIWDAACGEWQRLCAAGARESRAKKIVLRALAACGIELALTYSALRLSFSRKLERWKEGGYTPGALRDLRPENSGRREPIALSTADRHLLLARSLSGGLPMAWRGTLRSGELSAAVVQRYIGNPSSKSYVPQRVRDLITPDVEMLKDIHHGPRQAKLKGAYTTRDWSTVAAGDWYQADDCTLPLYYWEDGEDGQPHAIRGQCLVMTDLRTNRTLTFALHSERNYNAKVIRGLILATHDTYGLPREGFYFERGIWQSSKLLKGVADEVPVEETEVGLREWCRFMHARLPRAKPIERILGMLQDRMEDQPGYVGRNEQVEKFERVQKLLLKARTGQMHPREFLLHKDEWTARLSEICDVYNHEPQDGRLKGLSPVEAWETSFGVEPLTRLTESTRFLLANHRRPLKITRNGICIQLGKERTWFRNEETGRLIGRTVQVYFNPEDLSSVFVRLNPRDAAAVVVPAAPIIPAMDATPEEMAAASSSCEAHNRPARTLYSTIRPSFAQNGPTKFRAVIADGSTVASGREISAEQAAIRERQTEQTQTKRKLSSNRRRFGGTSQPDAVSVERQQQAYKLMEEATRDADA